MAANPFVYGEVVPGEAFVDREDELDRLRRDLDAGQKVFLISPRRYGKSSLIRQALTRSGRRGALTSRSPSAATAPTSAFLEGYARALAALETQVGPRAHLADGSHRGVAPELRLEPQDDGPGRVSRGVPARPDRARQSPAGQRGVRAARTARRARASAASSSRSTSSRRSTASTAAASSTRCAPPPSSSGRSATCSPAPSRA